LLIVGYQQLAGVRGPMSSMTTSVARTAAWPTRRRCRRSALDFGRLRRRDVLDGLIHEYEYAA
jgi:hypothetical protein